MTKSEKDLKKKREIAAKLTNPTPVERPGGSWRCQIMVNGRRIGVTDPDPAVAHAKALAMKAGIIEEEQNASLITVGKAIDRYIESKNAVLSPSTIAGYKRVRKNALQDIMSKNIVALTQEDIQRAINKMAKDKSPKATSL